MQASLPLSVDTRSSTGSSTKASSAPKGPDSLFAAHLAAASQEQPTPVQQRKAVQDSKNTDSSKQQTRDAEELTDNEHDAADSISADGRNGSENTTGQGVYAVPTTAEETAPDTKRDSSQKSMTWGNDELSSSKGQSDPSGQNKPLSTSANTTNTVEINNSNSANVPASTPMQTEGTLQENSINDTSRPLMQTAQATAVSTVQNTAALENSVIRIDNTGQSRILANGAADTAAPLQEGVQPTVAQTGAAQGTGQPNTAPPNTDQILQDEYGQIITIYQSSEPEEFAAVSAGNNRTATVDTPSLRQDVNNNYIHSHLPNNAAKTITANGNGQQQDTAKGNQQQHAHIPQEQAAANGAAQVEQTVSQMLGTLSGQEQQPLIFAHQQSSVPLAGSTSLSVGPSLISLPSGITVPEGTVVDQMIAHFSMNRQNESSAINLKLHPQELGELRMEIKVEQDNIKAHIIAQNPQAQEMIDKHLPRLREALEQQGLHLQEIEVTVAANDTAGDERFQQNTGQQQQLRSSRSKTSQPIFTLETSEEFREVEHAVSNLSVLA
jgi:flagellar hook-length control protein FliK